MRFLDLLSLILENLSRRKVRVALTAIGVVIGTAAVIVLVSLGIGLQQNATRNLYGIQELTRIDVYPQYEFEGGPGPVLIEGGGGSGAPPTPVPITNQTIEAIRTIPGVVAVVPRDGIQAQAMLTYGKLVAYANIVGLGVNDVKTVGVEVQSGTTKLERGTIIIGADVIQYYFANPNLRPNQPTPEPPNLQDQQLRLVVSKYSQDGVEIRRNVSLRVVGITARKGQESDGAVYMNLDEVTALSSWAIGRRINRAKDGYPQLDVRVDNVENVLSIANTIKNDLGFQAYTQQEFIGPINNTFLILQVIFGGVGAIALLVAAIGIANTMAMAILERTREIGLMKAVGATNQDVLSVFLGEAAGIGLIGGLGGVAVSWGLGQIINVLAQVYFSGQAPQPGGYTPPPMGDAVVTPIWLTVGALAFATFIGLVSGLYPALRAATLVPVNALKYE